MTHGASQQKGVTLWEQGRGLRPLIVGLGLLGLLVGRLASAEAPVLAACVGPRSAAVASSVEGPPSSPADQAARAAVEPGEASPNLIRSAEGG